MSSVGRGLLIAGCLVSALLVSTSHSASAAECADSSDVEGLNAFLQGDDAAGLAGADYPHAIDLPDGRTLWYFQDAFFGSGTQLHGAAFAHNAALIQDGDCFERLVAPGGDGNSWIGSWVETDLQNWLWPLDAEVGLDGHLWLFLAEVQNPNGNGAARGALPVGTWVARYSLPDLQLVDMELAPDPSRSLFGYSIVSDTEFSYLYGHCYRQFDAAGAIGFDSDCSPHAYVARVPFGEFDQELEYWTSRGWSDRRVDRLSVLSSKISMPVSVQRFGDVYVAASDEGDWFGDDVVIYTAAAPQGPWTEVLRYTPETACGEGCNNYGAVVLPKLDGDQVVIAQSNNARDMRYAFELASLYRPDVRAVDVPGVSAANLGRSPNMELALAEPEPAPPLMPAPMLDLVTSGSARSSATVAEPIEPARALSDGGTLTPGIEAIAWHVGGAASLTALVAGIVVWVIIAALTVAATSRRSRGRRNDVLRRVRAARAA